MTKYNYTEFINKYTIFLLLGILTIVVILYSLHRGLNFAEESFFNLHLRPHISNQNFSYWYKYFTFLPDSLLSLRYITLSIILTSVTILSIGFKAILPKQKLLFIIPIGVISTFIFSSPIQISPNYVIANKVVLFTSTGLLLLGVAQEKLKSSLIITFLAGVILAQVIFIMITTTPLIIFFILFPLVWQKDNYSIYRTLAILIGVIIGILIAFQLILSFDEYIAGIKAGLSELDTDQTHGFKAMIIWTLKTLKQFIIYIFVPSALLVKIYQNKGASSIVESSILLIYILFQFLLDSNTYYNITPSTSVYILGICIAFIQYYEKQWAKLYLTLFLLFIPYFGCLGTDVKFELRSVAYLTPLIIFCLLEVYNKAIIRNSVIIGITALHVFIFSFLFTTKTGWYRYSISNQTENNKYTSIKLDHDRIYNLGIVKEIIEPEANVFVSSAWLWGYIYLLKYKSPHLYFKFNNLKYNEYLMDNYLDSFYLLETSENPFSNETFNNDLYDYQIIARGIGSNKDLSIYKASKKSILH